MGNMEMAVQKKRISMPQRKNIGVRLVQDEQSYHF